MFVDRDERLAYAVEAQQLRRITRVFGRDAIDEAEQMQRAQRYVGGVADWRRNDVKRRGRVLLALREFEEVGHETKGAAVRSEAAIVPRGWR